jgi:hypothetical protein
MIRSIQTSWTFIFSVASLCLLDHSLVDLVNNFSLGRFPEEKSKEHVYATQDEKEESGGKGEVIHMLREDCLKLRYQKNQRCVQK